MNIKDTLIIGGGLSGLSLAYFLKQKSKSFEIIEARSRLGGRIFTSYDTDFPHEMGATWFANKHKFLNQLIEELSLNYKIQDYGQQAIVDQRPNGQVGIMNIPNQEEISYKFSHGSFNLVERLADQIKSEQIHLNQKVVKLIKHNGHIEVCTANNTYFGKKVVVSIPPNLVGENFQFVPKLDDEFAKLLQHTQTWMGDSIKIVLQYKADFWSNENFKGTLFSNEQIIQELHEHNSLNSYGLVGFINPKFNQLNLNDLENKAIEQLTDYFGKKAAQVVSIHIMKWQDEVFTSTASNAELMPHQLNGHQSLRLPRWEKSLYFGATETAKNFPGYMDGAVGRAHQLVNELD